MQEIIGWLKTVKYDKAKITKMKTKQYMKRFCDLEVTKLISIPES